MNFPSVSLFSSTANADLTKFFKRLGCEASTNAYSITGSTPLADSLFSVRYALYSKEIPNTELTAYMRESGGTYLYENLYTLPLGFVVPSDLESNWQYDMGNPAGVQNDLCDVLGNEHVLVRAEGVVSGNTCDFTADMAGEYYAYVANKQVTTVKASLTDETRTFNNTDRGYFLELGRLKAGEQITLTAEEGGSVMDVEIYRFSEPAMIALYKKLNNMPWKLTSWTDTRLEGKVTAVEGGVLYTSIPFDEGWTVTVDGEKAESYKIFETFLAFDMPEGEHEIVLTYFPKGLIPGIAVSVASVLLLVLLYIGTRMQKRKCTDFREEIFFGGGQKCRNRRNLRCFLSG